MNRVVPILALIFAACAAAVPFTPTPPAELPALQLRDAAGVFRCSAVAIAPRVALTAWHCAHESNISVASIHVTQFAQVAGDVAEAQLEHDIPGPYANVGPVPGVGQYAWIAGYGCDPNHEHVRERPLRVVWRGIGLTSEYAGRACPGDSGAGVWDAQGHLIGIVSARSIDGLPLRVFVSDLL